MFEPKISPKNTKTAYLSRFLYLSICEFSVLERETGFEPAIFSLARRCFTTKPLPLACRGRELNSRHKDFQSFALPLSYPGIFNKFSCTPSIQPLMVKNNFVSHISMLNVPKGSESFLFLLALLFCVDVLKN